MLEALLKNTTNMYNKPLHSFFYAVLTGSDRLYQTFNVGEDLGKVYAASLLFSSSTADLSKLSCSSESCIFWFKQSLI